MPLHFLLRRARPRRAASATPVDALTGAEAHHAAAVRRVRVGEEVTVGDGRGAWLTGRVRSPSRRARSSSGSPRRERHRRRRRPRIVLVQALAKGDRDELAVQAATELGVDEIVPWQAARSVSRWDSAKAREGPRPMGVDRARGGQAGAPRVAPRGRRRSTTTAELARRAAASRHPRPRAHGTDAASPRSDCARTTSATSCSSSARRAASRRRSSTALERRGATLGATRRHGAAHLDRGTGGARRGQRGPRPLVSARRPGAPSVDWDHERAVDLHAHPARARSPPRSSPRPRTRSPSATSRPRRRCTCW